MKEPTIKLSLLETLVTFYLRKEELSGYFLCDKLKKDGVLDFFHYTEAAVYRCVKRLAEKDILNSHLAESTLRESIQYKMNLKYKNNLILNILMHLSLISEKPENRIMLGCLHDIKKTQLQECVSDIKKNCEKILRDIEEEFETYTKGKFNIGRWTLLIQKRNIIEANLKTLDEVC